MDTSPAYAVTARNTAVSSDNKIHDDAVAATYGFAGGLVPGVDVYAYLTHVPVDRWGIGWLRSGTVAARFAKPVYDGDAVSIVAEEEAGGRRLALELRDSGGAPCASGTATLDGSLGAGTDEAIERAPLPAERPAASTEALRPGTVLGTVDTVFEADGAAGYLADVREAAALYVEEGIAHPGWLLRLANAVLVANVRLGPWIHVSSDVRLLGLVHDGDHVEARARVVDEHERKGHRFVVLDVAVAADDRLVQRITHTAIWEPRRLAPAAVPGDGGGAP